LSGQAVLHEHFLQRASSVGELGVAVGEENEAKRDAKNQQTQRLK
jgi:hypothetical protein